MKKLILAGFILICSVFYLNAQEVTVKDVSGKVEFMIPGGRWAAVGKGITIPLKATIATGFQSRAVLESSRAVIIVQPLTRLSVEELQTRSSGSQTSLSLRTGRISASVKKNDAEPTRFQVKSPIATAAVRGTEFTFNGFQLSVQSGLVAFGSPDGRVVTVPAGRFIEMLAGGVPEDVIFAILQDIMVNPMAVSDEILSFLDSIDYDLSDIFDLIPDDLIPDDLIPEDDFIVTVQ